MESHTRKDLITLLREWGNDDFSRLPSRAGGVCLNLLLTPLACTMKNRIQIRKAIRLLGPSAPYYSGNSSYPVSHPLISDPVVAFKTTVDHWDGEYGRRRCLFCLHLAAQLELGL